MNLILLYHNYIQEIFLSNIGHSHWWFHVVMHTSMAFVPISLLTMSIFYLRRLYQSASHRKHQAIGESSNIHPYSALPASFVKYFFKHTKHGQLRIVGLVLLSLPIYYGTLELPKLIINNAILAEHFPFLLLGTSFDQVQFLMFLSGLYLLFIIGNGLIKFAINTSKGALGEKVIRRLRLTLFKAFKRQHNPKLNSANLIPMIGQEVEPIGGFAAEVISVPILQGGTLITIFVFFILQDPILAFAAISMLPIQLYIIPKLQQKVNILSRKRVIEIRALSQKISVYEQKKIKEQKEILSSVKTIENIRIELFRRKFFLKSLNNLLISITPFFFYSIGGLLVIEERISIGTLIASIAAYKDLSSPIKELLSYYQNYENVRIRYQDLSKFIVTEIRQRSRLPIRKCPSTN